MSTINQPTALFAPVPNVGLKALLDEAAVLFDALLHPAKIIAEVEQMRALQLEADRIEASDPARAAALRQRASRTGLR